MKNFISLPSGIIINLDRIVWIFPDGKEIYVTAPAMAIGPKMGSSLRIIVRKSDIPPFLAALEERNINTKALVEALKEADAPKQENDVTIKTEIG